MSNKEIVFGDAKFVKYATEETDVIVWHDCLGPLNLTFKELSDKISRGELPIGTTIAAVFNKAHAEKTKPIWTWEDKRLKILPEVDSEIMETTTRIVYSVLKKNKEGFVVATISEDGKIIVGYYTKEEIELNFSPYETLQQKYNRECQEYCSKALTELVQGKTGRFEILQKFYEELKPFQEDKKD